LKLKIPEFLSQTSETVTIKRISLEKGLANETEVDLLKLFSFP
jgi:hypothetical protein